MISKHPKLETLAPGELVCPEGLCVLLAILAGPTLDICAWCLCRFGGLAGTLCQAGTA